MFLAYRSLTIRLLNLPIGLELEIKPGTRVGVSPLAFYSKNSKVPGCSAGDKEDAEHGDAIASSLDEEEVDEQEEFAFAGTYPERE